MSQLRAAVVGVGYLGNFHAQKYKNNSQVKLVGVCDFSPEQAQKIAASLQVESFSKAHDLIGKVDLVTIAASTQSHYELAKLFLSAGVHVNVEKPITATLPQAEEIINLALQKNLLLAVGQIERFNPAVIEFKKHSTDLMSLELIRHAPYKTRGADVSVLHDLMIHDIDIMHDVTGSKVKNFYASGSKLISKEFDTCVGTFELENSQLVHIDVSRVASLAKRSLRAICKNQIFNINTGTLEVERSVRSTTDATVVDYQVYQVEKKDALQSETDAFIDAVLRKAPLKVTGQDGYLALQLVEKIIQKIS